MNDHELVVIPYAVAKDAVKMLSESLESAENSHISQEMADVINTLQRACAGHDAALRTIVESPDVSNQAPDWMNRGVTWVDLKVAKPDKGRRCLVKSGENMWALTYSGNDERLGDLWINTEGLKEMRPFATHWMNAPV
jgi:hypothetical protein